MSRKTFDYSQIDNSFHSFFAHIARLFAWIYFKFWYFLMVKVALGNNTDLEHVFAMPGSTVVFVNHQAQEDHFLLRMHLGFPMRFMMNERQFRRFNNRDLSWLLTAGGAIPVPKKDSLQSHKRMFSYVRKLMVKKEIIVVYAQAGRFNSDTEITCPKAILRYLEHADNMVIAGIAGTQMPKDIKFGRRKLAIHVHKFKKLLGERDAISIEYIQTQLTFARSCAQELLK